MKMRAPTIAAIIRYVRMHPSVGVFAQRPQKPRMLPFRISPTVKHAHISPPKSHHPLPRPLLASHFTPVESAGDEDGQPPYPSSTPPVSLPSSQPTVFMSSSSNPRDDSDTDMMDSQPATSSYPWEDNDNYVATITPPRPLPSDISLETPSRQPHAAPHGGRIDTPRWGHFRPVDTSTEMSDAPDGTLSDISTSSQLDTSHRAFLRRRRLPSPIGEDRSMMTSPVMAEETVEGTNMVNAQAHRIMMMEQIRSARDAAWNEKSPRSKPGKTILSMGYRADCEKCRSRVPGHYNHVIKI